jgi:hypothetical protein
MKNSLLLIFALLISACTKTEVELPTVGSLEGGSWYVDCYQNTGGSFETRTASFEGGSYEHVLSLYNSDWSCSQKALELRETGTYVIGGPAATGSSMYKLDNTITTLTIKPLTTIAVNNYNTSAMCGLTNWALNVAQDVTGLNCGAGTLPAAGTAYYDIYIIFPVDLPPTPGFPGSGTTAGTLNFGYTNSTNDGTTPAKRPNSVTSPDYHR